MCTFLFYIKILLTSSGGSGDGQKGKDMLGYDSDVKVVKNTVFWSWTNW